MPKLWFAIVALALASLLFAGCGSTYRQGWNYLDAGEYEAARQVFETMLPGQSGDDKAELLVLIGRTYYDESEYDQAIPYFEDAKKADAKCGKAHLYLGMVYEKKGEYARSIQEYESYCKLGRFSLMRQKLKWRAKRLRDKVAIKKAIKALRIEEQLKDNEYALQQETQKIPENHVAVMDFQHLTSKRYKGLEKGIADFAIEGLMHAKPLIVVLERTEIQLLIQEIERSKRDVYSANPPQKGRFLRANYIVCGSFSTPGESGDKKIEIVPHLAIAKESKEKALPGVPTISPNEFFRLHKPLVTRILQGIGIYSKLTPEQRQAIGRIPTESFLAFLAYCDGLDTMDIALDYLESGMYKEARTSYLRAKYKFKDALEEDRKFRRESGIKGEFSLARERFCEAELAERELVMIDLTDLEQICEELEEDFSNRDARLAQTGKKMDEGFALLEEEYESGRKMPVRGEVTTVDVTAEF